MPLNYQVKDRDIADFPELSSGQRVDSRATFDLSRCGRGRGRVLEDLFGSMTYVQKMEETHECVGLSTTFSNF